MIAALRYQNRGVGWPRRVAHLDRKPSQDGRSAILLEGDRQACGLVWSRECAIADSRRLRDASSFETEARQREAAEITGGVGLGPIPPHRSALDEWVSGRCRLLTNEGRVLCRQAVLGFLGRLCGACAAGIALKGRLIINLTPAQRGRNRVATSRGGLTGAAMLRDWLAGNFVGDRGAAR